MTSIAAQGDAEQPQSVVLAQASPKASAVSVTKFASRLFIEPGDTDRIKLPGHIGEYLKLRIEDRQVLRDAFDAFFAIPENERPWLRDFLLRDLGSRQPTWSRILDRNVVVDLIRWSIHLGILPEWRRIQQQMPEYRVTYFNGNHPVIWIKPQPHAGIVSDEWDENIDGGHSYGYLGEARGFRAVIVQVLGEKNQVETYLDFEGVLPDGTVAYHRQAITLKTHQAKKGLKRGRYVMLDSRYFPKWLLAELRPLMHIPDAKCRDRRVYLHRVLAALWFGRKLNPNGRVKPLQVHHLNELVKDNRLLNLLALTEAEHAQFHDNYRWGMSDFNDLGVVGSPAEVAAEDAAEGLGCTEEDFAELHQLLAWAAAA